MYEEFLKTPQYNNIPQIKLFQPIPNYSHPFHPIPPYFSLYQPIPAKFSPYQPTSAYASLCQPIKLIPYHHPHPFSQFLKKYTCFFSFFSSYIFVMFFMVFHCLFIYIYIHIYICFCILFYTFLLVPCHQLSGLLFIRARAKARATPTARATDPPLLTPPLCTVCWFANSDCVPD